jgi:hypothetical protein
MFSVLKFIYILYKAFRDGLNPNLNSLRHAPVYLRYLTSILLACFWCLAFGIYIGELVTIGYNMIGHIALITMAFSTGFIMSMFRRAYAPRVGTDQFLRMPDRSSRCDELTEEQRLKKIHEWNNRNVWNDPVSSKKDNLAVTSDIK